MKTKLILGAVAATALAVPAVSSGHATVSAVQPQGAAALQTATRTSYVLRAPNEEDKASTWKLVMYVPGPVQQSISVRQSPDWKIRLQRTADGAGITRISWTAKTQDAEIEPGMFGEFAFRFQNPATPQTLCFPISQYYRNADGTRRKPLIVEWQGDPAAGAEHPKSCLNITT